MRILVAGATGAIGRQLVPMLVRAAHHVTGTSLTASGVRQLEQMGASGVTMDALDETRVKEVVDDLQPEVVIHQVTAIGAVRLRRLDEGFAMTNRLRTEGLDYLLRAAIDSGASRFIAQSFTGWTNNRTGAAAKTESDPLEPEPAPRSHETLEAIRHVESTVTSTSELVGVALRYGNLYGPGTAYSEGGEMYNLVRARRLPVVGAGSGVWSFVHVRDAAMATSNAVTRGGSGVYNVVDDEPAPVSVWLPYFARVIGAKPPLRLPVWMARPLIGELGIRFMTEIRGAANVKAKGDLDWVPGYPSWRDGFTEPC